MRTIDTMAEDFPDLEQQITELDISVYNASDNTSNYGNNIPPSVLAEQGWLYAQYFDALRQLRGKLSAVPSGALPTTIPGSMVSPSRGTDYPLPFDMGLQAKPAYWGIVDPTQLPGYGMTFTDSTVAGQQNTRTVMITATNGSVGPAYATLIKNFDLTQISGTSCTPKITPPGNYPISLGDIPTSGSANAAFVVDITGCDPTSQFLLAMPWSSSVYDTEPPAPIPEFPMMKGK